ncbi:putative U-box domain-containing protein 33 [Iris pallida]|uniref:RING-type E3 ubiquitin transferase n=1 Tax=Iris pallida TaxID=29817 RepID=A0AAX6HJ93_IRIPA|nr:putative U-box domain-containing protein 33 [Iris pallida]
MDKKKMVQVGNFMLEMKAVDDGHIVLDMHVVDKSADRGKAVAESPVVVDRVGKSTLKMQTATPDYNRLLTSSYTTKAHDLRSSSNKTSIAGESKYMEAALLKEAGEELCSGARTNYFDHYKGAELSNVYPEKPYKSNHNKKIQEATKKSQETSNAEVAELAVSSEVLISSYKASSIPRFSYAEIKGATHDDFNKYAKIGEGRHWTVYEGRLGKTKVAIKKLAVETKHGESEFRGELEFILSQLSHPNLVKPLGACLESQALVYEFVPNGSLEDYFTEKRSPELLTWQIRTHIVYDICSALIFLHNSKPNPVVHGNLKPSSVLLDANFRCKLSNFGLSRFLPQSKLVDDAFHKTLPMGTFGYIDPEFVATGKLKPSSDVYSFGVTILRILTGLSAVGIKGKVPDAYDEQSEKLLMRLVDTTAGRWPTDVVKKLAGFAFKFCDEFEKSSKLLYEFSTELKAILANID